LGKTQRDADFVTQELHVIVLVCKFVVISEMIIICHYTLFHS